MENTSAKNAGRPEKGSAKSRGRKKDKFLRQLPLYLMLVPAVVLVAIYAYGSMVGVVIAFQNFKLGRGLFGSDWVGLKNFRSLFALPNFWPVIRNTVVIALGKMIGGVIVPVTFSLLLNEIGHSGLKRSLQTMVYLPNFLSWIILAGLFFDILSPSTGIIGRMFTALGLNPPFFLGDPKLFPGTMIVLDIWKGFGFGSVIYLAALTGIDQNLYEAAQIDGANRIQQTWHITLPGILSTVVLMTVLSMANILNGGFDEIYNLYNASVYSTGDILDTFVFRLGIENAQFALSTAAGLFKSAVSFVFIVASYWMADRFAGYRIF